MPVTRWRRKLGRFTAYSALAVVILLPVVFIGLMIYAKMNPPPEMRHATATEVTGCETISTEKEDLSGGLVVSPDNSAKPVILCGTRGGLFEYPDYDHLPRLDGSYLFLATKRAYPGLTEHSATTLGRALQSSPREKADTPFRKRLRIRTSPTSSRDRWGTSAGRSDTFCCGRSAFRPRESSRQRESPNHRIRVPLVPVLDWSRSRHLAPPHDR